MIRDFSESARNELRALAKQVEEDKFSDFTDWLGDRFYDFEDLIGLLKIKPDLSNVTAFHKKIIDKNNYSIDELNVIFEQIDTVERRFSNSFKNFKDTCKELKELTDTLTQTIAPSGGKLSADALRALNGTLYSYSRFVNARLTWQLELDAMLRKYSQQDSISAADKDALIAFYEKNNPEIAGKLNKLIEKLSLDHQREIKFIIYSSNEPYRSIYLKELGTFTIGNTAISGFFRRADNTINMKIDDEPSNSGGPYRTYFHESGHAIDYNYQNDGKFYSLTYRDSAGRSLQEVLYKDVRNNLQNTVAEYTTDPQTQAHLMNYIMGHGQVDISTLSATEKKLLEGIQADYRSEMAYGSTRGVSDVYGGVTDNIIHGSGWHTQQYYWYDINGRQTGSQSKELFAHYYSACVTGNEETLANFEKYFPEAKKFMDGMMESME